MARLTSCWPDILCLQEEVKEQLDNLRKVEQKNARIKISLGQSTCQPSILRCPMRADDNLSLSAEEMKRKLRTLQNAPSEEDLKSRYQRELKSVIKEKLKLDLEHTVCT